MNSGLQNVYPQPKFNPDLNVRYCRDNEDKNKQKSEENKPEQDVRDVAQKAFNIDPQKKAEISETMKRLAVPSYDESEKQKSRVARHFNEKQTENNKIEED